MKTNRYLDLFIAPTFILAFLLAGHFGFFEGHSFIAEEDHLSNLNYSSGDSFHTGWRPDIGLGTNLFWGDPGAFHPWSVFRLWSKFWGNDVVAYNSSIILLLWALCLSQYFFLRQATPSLGKTSSIFLSLLIAFGSLRYEFLFNRHWIAMAICTGPISLLLHNFLRRPSIKHYFQYTFILFILCTLGSLVSLLQMILFSILFFTIYAFSGHLNNNSQSKLKLARNYFTLNAVSGLILVLLLGWNLYGLFLEKSLMSYVRDPYYEPDSFFHPLKISFVLNQLIQYFHAGIFSPWMKPLGLEFLPIGNGWNNVSPIFPIIFLFFLFHRTKNFWEFSTKFIVLFLLAWQQLVNCIPGIIGLIQSAINSYPPEKFHPIIQVYEVLIIGIIIQKLREENLGVFFSKWNIPKFLNLILILLYSGLFFLTLIVFIFPNALINFLKTCWNLVVPFIHSKTILVLAPSLIEKNVILLSEIMGFSSILFFGTTLILLLTIFSRKWAQLIQVKEGKAFGLALLANSIFLSWAVYPLNKEPLIWDLQDFSHSSPTIIFEKFDRTATVGLGSCKNSSDLIECIEVKYFGEFGSKRYVLGYKNLPGLEFSAAKSFTQENVAAFIQTFLEIEGINKKGILRRLSAFPNFYNSKLYDFAGVKYFSSQEPLPPSKSIELVYSSLQFYLYRNLDAWPYFYLANQVEPIGKLKDLYQSEKGIAYIWEKDYQFMAFNKRTETRGSAKLSRFNYGDMEFNTSSKNEEFLVIADAWHPLWKALVDGEENNILKANGVFKGIFLPPGNHKIHLFFDNSPYRPGVWISIISGILFIFAWVLLTVKESKPQKEASLETGTFI